METTGRAHVDRRALLRYGAAATAAVAVSPALPALGEPASARTTPDVLPAPKPIPGGLELPDGSRIHVSSRRAHPDSRCRSAAQCYRDSMSSRVSSPTTAASPPSLSTSARRQMATARRTTWRPTSG
jgi:hypothetical protein